MTYKKHSSWQIRVPLTAPCYLLIKSAGFPMVPVLDISHNRDLFRAVVAGWLGEPEAVALYAACSIRSYMTKGLYDRATSVTSLR
jgi:hypothetical protein